MVMGKEIEINNAISLKYHL